MLNEDQFFLIDKVISDLKSIQKELAGTYIKINEKTSYRALIQFYKENFVNDRYKKQFNLIYSDQKLLELETIYQNNKTKILLELEK